MGPLDPRPTRVTVGGVYTPGLDISVDPIDADDIPGLATVARTGSYADLINKPAGGGGSGDLVMTRVFKAASQPVTADGGLAEITMGSVSFNRGGFTIYDNGVAVPQSGLYRIVAALWWTGGAGVRRNAILRVNYAQQAEVPMPVLPDIQAVVTVEGIALAANDFVHLWSYTGEDNTTTQVAAGSRFTWMAVQRIGSAT